MQHLCFRMSRKTSERVEPWESLNPWTQKLSEFVDTCNRGRADVWSFRHVTFRWPVRLQSSILNAADCNVTFWLTYRFGEFSMGPIFYQWANLLASLPCKRSPYPKLDRLWEKSGPQRHCHSALGTWPPFFRRRRVYRNSESYSTYKVTTVEHWFCRDALPADWASPKPSETGSTEGEAMQNTK